MRPARRQALLSPRTAPRREAPPEGAGGGRAGRAPRWPWIVGLALCAAGFCVVGYLTYEHYTGSTSLYCPAHGGFVNCFAVTTSVYSRIHGIPVVVLGLVFFAVMAALQSPWSWRSARLDVRVARIAWSTAGVATALWLVYAELFKLDQICLECTSVHVITLLLFASTVFGTASLATISGVEEP